jgi:hypothetical protein
MIASSAGEGLTESVGLGLGPDVGANVWASNPTCVAKIDSKQVERFWSALTCPRFRSEATHRLEKKRRRVAALQNIRRICRICE